MKRIKVSLVAILVLLTALWLAADSLLPEPFTYFQSADWCLNWSLSASQAICS